MNLDGPEQDKVFWITWGAMVAVITIAIVVGVVVA